MRTKLFNIIIIFLTLTFISGAYFYPLPRDGLDGRLDEFRTQLDRRLEIQDARIAARAQDYEQTAKAIADLRATVSLNLADATTLRERLQAAKPYANIFKAYADITEAYLAGSLSDGEATARFAAAVLATGDPLLAQVWQGIQEGLLRFDAVLIVAEGKFMTEVYR